MPTANFQNELQDEVEDSKKDAAPPRPVGPSRWPRTVNKNDFEKWHSVMLRDLENDGDGNVPQNIQRKTKEAWRGDSAKQATREGKSQDNSNVSHPAQHLMTGNKDADEDIMAFFKAKEEMMKRVRGKQSWTT